MNEHVHVPIACVLFLLFFCVFARFETKRRLWNRFIIMQSVCHIRELLLVLRTYTTACRLGGISMFHVASRR